MEGARVLFIAPICALIYTVALRALVSNKNPSFLLRSCVFQGSENGPHCDHVDSPERPEFLPAAEKLNSWGGKRSRAPSRLCPRRLVLGLGQSPETPQALCLSPDEDLCHCSIHSRRTKLCLSVCLL